MFQALEEWSNTVLAGRCIRKGCNMYEKIRFVGLLDMRGTVASCPVLQPAPVSPTQMVWFYRITKLFLTAGYWHQKTARKFSKLNGDSPEIIGKPSNDVWRNWALSDMLGPIWQTKCWLNYESKIALDRHKSLIVMSTSLCTGHKVDESVERPG